MKNKKKILAASLLAGLLFTTSACSSNVKFNQDNLDKLIVSGNTYFEEQNNYSAEFAKNRLLDYLAKGIYKLNKNDTSFKVTVDQNYSDTFGNVINEEEMVYKKYFDSTTHTETVYYGDGTESDDGFYMTHKKSNADNSDEESIYEITVYDVASKQYTKTIANTGEKLDNAIFVSFNPGDYYNAVIKFALEEGVSVIMDKLENNVEEFIALSKTGDRFMKIAFEDGMMTSFIQFGEVEEEEGSKYIYNRYESKCSLEYNIESFEIPDLNSYTEK